MIKATLHYLTIMILNLVSIGAGAQEITCNSFCLTDVRMDTSAPNLMYVSLFFTGGNNDFINYPWIAEVINDQGDTVGVGTWNFFGQFGNTSNDYPVMVEFDSIPDNFNAKMIFHYDTSICLLSFPCSMTGFEDQNENQQVSIYPNPFSSETTVHSETAFHDLSIKIFDLRGHLVKQFEALGGFEIRLNREGLCPGMYFVQLVDDNKTISMRKIMIVN